MNIKGFNVIWALFLSISLAANNAVSLETPYEMEQRLNKMSVPELVAQAKELQLEAALLQEEKESSQSPEKIRDISNRQSSIGSELDMIRTILIAVGKCLLLVFQMMTTMMI